MLNVITRPIKYCFGKICDIFLSKKLKRNRRANQYYHKNSIVINEKRRLKNQKIKLKKIEDTEIKKKEEDKKLNNKSFVKMYHKYYRLVSKLQNFIKSNLN